MLASAPNIFIYYLDRLAFILQKIDVMAGDKTLQARLTDDMLPLINHVRACANFSLRGCCPLIGQPVVSFENEINSFDGLQQQIEQTITHLNSLVITEANLPKSVQDKAGFATVTLGPYEYLFQYIFPNFYFHLNMVYAIARQQGVPLSKQDYDAYHKYPTGFSFER